jgi:hypothetical protein
MVSKLDDLDMVTNVEAVVGTYAGAGTKYTFECEDGKTGHDGPDAYLAVKYDEWKNPAGRR